MKLVSRLVVQLMFRGFVAGLLLVSLAARAELPDFRDLVKETSPAVVNISTVQHARPSRFSQQYDAPDDMPDIFRHFFGIPYGSPYGNPDGNRDQASMGSGFIVSEDGYILTNNHVVEGADEIVVRLNDRRELDATLIGSDPSTDLAVLKVEADHLPTVKLGDSDALEVGEWVVAIGSPFGFDYSVTAGIVSALGRSLPNENYVPFIQTDVAINPGNSGGPLFNLDGKVVGINSQIYTRSGGFMGVSFAIPINVAMNVAEQLKTTGRVDRGWLGVVIQEVSKPLAESFGLDKAEGALIVQVIDGSPAEDAGLQSGDIITTVNGKRISLSSDLPHQIGRLAAGDKAELRIIRSGKAKTIKVTIGTLPEAGAQASTTPKKQEKTSDRTGMVVQELTDRQSQQYGNGVLVAEVENGGPAARAGIIPGDIISQMGGKTIRSMSDFNSAVKDLPENRSVAVRIVRRGQASFIPFTLQD